MSDSILREIALIGAAGVASQWLSWRFGVPAIALLLLSGLALGPASGLVAPRQDFGPLLQPLVSAAVALILFEGGLSLNFAQLRETSAAVRRVIFLGGPLSALAGALAAHYIAGLSWPTAIVLAALLVVTGPTVIAPLLKGARLDKRVAAILRWESIVNDPIGALLAVIALEVAAAAQGAEGFGPLLLAALGGLIFAVLAGFAGARALAALFERGHAPEHLKAPLLLTAVLGLFVLSNALFDEAGLMAVTVMGVTLANTPFASLTDLRRFKESVVALLVSGVFIVLTASVDPASLRALDLRAGLFIFVLLFLLRPAAMALATIGAGLDWRERLFVGWIAPRGVVAVAVSALFGQRLIALGAADGARLAPIVFAIVCATVMLHGFSLKPLARSFRLSGARRRGVLLVGASPWTLALAQKLAEGEVPALIVDPRRSRLLAARMAGLAGWHGEILSAEAHHSLELADFSHLIAATENDAYNTLVCQEYGAELGRDRVFQLGAGREDPDPRSVHFTIGGRRLLGSSQDSDSVNARLNQGWGFSRSQLSEKFTFDDWRAQKAPETEILFWIAQGGEIAMSEAPGDARPGAGDALYAFGPALRTPAAAEEAKNDRALEQQPPGKVIWT